MSFFGFGSTCDLDIEFKDQDKLPVVEFKNEAGELEPVVLFTGRDTIAGQVQLKLSKGKKIEHIGMKIELIGHIELLYDRGNPYEFTSLVRELEAPGELVEDKSYPFEFKNVEKQYESYSGNNVRLRYFLRVKITRSYSSKIGRAVQQECRDRSRMPSSA
eukprot:TRINITY_DN13372_c0_g1_i3.p1 TRINITY_DN13372_c0_g1~~TRINITY_DN13372_c0_g1_i3.p1  ORF type:complete len:173 (-),score=18.97 TRINITY_DN13372_c0_g1_i3:11-490(-)